MNFKKGNISFYVVIGIVILLGVVLLVGYNNSVAVQSIEKEKVDFSSEINAAAQYVENCLGELTKEAIDSYGLTEKDVTDIKNYILKNAENCVNNEYLLEQGFEIKTGDPNVDVVIDEAVIITLSYPIEFEKDGSKTDIDEFTFSFDRLSVEKIEFDDSGKTSKEMIISSHDGGTELIIPKGTHVSSSDDSPIDKIFLKIIEKDFNNLDNEVVLSNIVYEGLPDGVIFDPPISMNVEFNPDTLPEGFDKESLTIMYYDEVRGFWIGIPTTVNTETNILTAKVEHFTKFAPGVKYDTLREDYGRVFMHLYGDEETCKSEYWEVTENWVDRYDALSEKQRNDQLPLIHTQNEQLDTMSMGYQVTTRDWDEDDHSGLIDASSKCNDERYEDEIDCTINPNINEEIDQIFITGDHEDLDDYSAAVDSLANGVKDGKCTCSWDPELSKDICECERATFRTWGYSDKDFGGSIKIPFFILGNGRGKLEYDEDRPKIKLSLKGSAGDRFGSSAHGWDWWHKNVRNLNPDGLQGDGQEYQEVQFFYINPNRLEYVWNDKTEEYEHEWSGFNFPTRHDLHPGWNEISLFVQNDNMDGELEWDACLYADAIIEIEGATGIYFDEAQIPEEICKFTNVPADQRQCYEHDTDTGISKDVESCIDIEGDNKYCGMKYRGCIAGFEEDFYNDRCDECNGWACLKNYGDKVRLTPR